MELLVLLLPALFLTVNGCLRIRGPLSDKCSPTDPSTLLFAYSNDLNYTEVQGTIQHVSDGINMFYPNAYYKYVVMATVRFDTKTKEDVVFHEGETLLRSFWAARDHMNQQEVNISQRFDSSETGSDVLDMLERFIDTNRSNICGSTALILMKRHLNEIETSKIVEKLREYRIRLKIAIEDPSSGGLQPETMYDLAAKTNGYCSISTDLSWAVFSMPSLYKPFTHYSYNLKVSNGTEKVVLPPLTPLETNILMFYIAVQSTATATSFQHFEIRCSNSNYSDYNARKRQHLKHGSENSFTTHNFIRSAEPALFNVTLEYTYSTEDTILIRMYSDIPIDHWLPFQD